MYGAVCTAILLVVSLPLIAGYSFYVVYKDTRHFNALEEKCVEMAKADPTLEYADTKRRIFDTSYCVVLKDGKKSLFFAMGTKDNLYPITNPNASPLP
jgi:hypothetical protein